MTEAVRNRQRGRYNLGLPVDLLPVRMPAMLEWTRPELGLSMTAARMDTRMLRQAA